VPWVDSVDLVAVELHTPETRKNVERALDSAHWSHERRGEIDLFKRAPRPAVAADQT
jgi:hypothetical protein